MLWVLAGGLLIDTNNICSHGEKRKISIWLFLSGILFWWSFFVLFSKLNKHTSQLFLSCLKLNILASVKQCIMEYVRKFLDNLEIAKQSGIGQDKGGYPVNIFSYFFTKTYVVGTH